MATEAGEEQGQNGVTEQAPDPTTATASTADPPNTPPSQSLDLEQAEKAKPKDFEGQLATNNNLPSAATLKGLENFVVLDRHSKSHTFKSLYTGHNVARRMLVIFVRHFFCGNCQEYLRTLAESITTEALLRLPVSTFITVIGCGDPRLIDFYVETTKCPFPVYSDPKGTLFDALGMVKTLALGERPAYMKKSIAKSSIDSVGQVLRHITWATKSGDQRQVGGEFLFEPFDVATPISTPKSRTGKLQEGDEDGRDDGLEEKTVSWCHRMKTTRDHAEIPELMHVLGLEGDGKPIADKDLWSKAVTSRKGTGTSLAARMNGGGSEVTA